MVNVPTPLEELHHSVLEEKQVRLFVKRDDLIHGEIMGNKWRKLKYNLKEAKRLGHNTIVSMGGAFSNHIHALAAAGSNFQFNTIGIIRGEELNHESNETLRFAHENGMQLEFISRPNYTVLRKNPTELKKRYPDCYWLPEGGTNQFAIQGCSELVHEITMDFDVIALPIGTGGTFCGVVDGVNENQSVLGISSLKGEFIKKEVLQLMQDYQINKSNYQINTDYHFGGYGKSTTQLVDFINWFKEKFSISLDPIYTGKCFFAVWDMIISGKFEKNLKIVILHTGGLQGILGFNRKKQNIIQ